MPINMLIILVILGLGFFILYRIRYRKDNHAVQSKDALLTPEELEKHVREVAKTHIASRNTGESNCLVDRMDRNFDIISSVYLMLNEDVKRKRPVPPAAEWLLDNFYIIEEQVKGIRQNLVKEKCRNLHTLTSGYLKGYPRIFALALELVSHLDGRLDEKTTTDFVTAYQSQNILSMSELWALPIMLKMALIENVKNVCEKIRASQIEWRKVEDLKELDPENIKFFISQNIVNWNSASYSLVEHLLKKLRRQGAETEEILNYLDQKLLEFDISIVKVVHEEHQEQANMQVAMGNSISSIRLVAAVNWNNVFEKLSVVEQILRSDPDGTYSGMDFASRDYYRHTVEKLARQLKTSETNIARKALDLAQEVQDKNSLQRHVGYYLVGDGLNLLLKRLGSSRSPGQKPAVGLYIASIGIITVLISILFAAYAYLNLGEKNIGAVLLAGLVTLIPASDIAVALVNRLFTSLVEPTFFPKMSFEQGIPEEATALVVVPTLLPNVQRVKELVQQLEVHYLANREDHLYFALLGDLKDAETEVLPNDQDIIDTALEEIKKLNDKYASGQDIFFFFSRHRIFSPQQNRWMGWERKRGALVELNNFLTGQKETSFNHIPKHTLALRKVKYVITLDADTKIPLHMARKMIGTISHPLNRPVFDEQKGIVVEGYGLIQPRINVSTESANSTLFSRIFAGQGGIDPYTTAISDVYQDCFGEGIFTGKGIYDVSVFQKALHDAVPDNTVLSHDLLEGSYIRVGLATNLVLVDGYPVRYNSFMMRLHRWVRGDWQLLPWLFPRVKNRKGDLVPNPLTALSRWKIIDNLRRSLVSPAVLVLLAAGLFLLPGQPLVWLGLGLVTIGMPIFSGVVDFFVNCHYKTMWHKCHGNMVFGLKAVFYQAGLLLLFLPYHAYLMLDAVIRTLYRVFVSRKNLLEWVTAADVERNLNNDLRNYFRSMFPAVLQALALVLLVWFFRLEHLEYAVLFGVAWLASPVAAYYVSQIDKRVPEEIDSADQEFLYRLARKTWAYYEDFAGETDHFLPPDNFQENPPNGIAHRTSPTNIGFLLIAVLSARDLGWIGMQEMVSRLEKTLATVKNLKKWKGHLYNWYDTTTLEVLRPAYVSTVDSGNFVGYLMTLKQGLLEYLERPLIDMQMVRGLSSSLSLVEKPCPETARQANALLEKGQLALEEWRGLLETAFGELSMEESWGKRLARTVIALKRELQDVFPNVDPEILQSKDDKKMARLVQYFQGLGKKSLARLEQGYSDLLHEINQMEKEYPRLSALKAEVLRVEQAAKELQERVKHLVTAIDELVAATSFVPLYDHQKRLFSIGYNVDEEKLTNSYYDLLASEARITSFLAVARGEVPTEHWFRLGKSLTYVEGYKGLVSWSGTMFEYFMPCLIMKDYPNTLLSETYHFALLAQKRYGKKRGVPWGTSESGFFSFDVNLNYQYKAFGVPDLGLKRGLVDDMVVSPYSTILALPFDPVGAVQNLKRLEEEGLEGDYGFYEAVDYTTERLFMGKNRGIVQSYMAHHQGMSLIALNNYLNGQVMQERFHHDPLVKAGELLLQEKVPIRVIITKEHKEDVRPFEIPDREEGVQVSRELTGVLPGLPACHLLSNGRYSLLITERGSGYSTKDGIQVTRWRENHPVAKYGLFVFIQNAHSSETWSVAYEPLKKEPDEYRVIFLPDKAEFIRTDGRIGTHMMIAVSPEDSVEIRKIVITNHGEEQVVLDVTSYGEMVLTSPAADAAHPVFSNLFVQTEHLAKYNAILSYRRPRGENEEVPWAVHGVVVEGEVVGGLELETDRSKFLGRGRDITQPLALDFGHPLSNTTGAVLDPIISLRRRVKINPGKVVVVSFFTGVAETREQALEWAEKYHETAALERAFELAWTRSQVEDGYLGLKANEVKAAQELIPHITFLSPLRKRYGEIYCQNKKGQQGLWAYGVSGDLPIVLLRVKQAEDISIVRSMLKIHEYLRFKGLKVDLVILNEEEAGYFQSLHELIREAISVSHARDIQDRPGGVFLRNANTMPPEDLTLFMTVVRIILTGENGPILSQLKITEAEQPSLPGEKIFSQAPTDYVSRDELPELVYYNGYGGFTPDGREYVIRLKDRIETPAPWINVVANPDFGFIISESGSGYVWAENSRENKITPWFNDPVTNPPGEIVYLRDDETGEIWSPTPLPMRKDDSYTVRHGLGYSSFQHHSHGVDQGMTVFVPVDDPVKISLVKLKNTSKTRRRLSLTYFVQTVLGVSEQAADQYISTEATDSGALHIRNSYNTDFPGRVVFIDCSEKISSFTGDRSEFIGAGGDIKNPQALKREGLSNRVGCGLLPCAAIQLSFELEPGMEKEVVLLLGQGKNQEDARRIAARYRDLTVSQSALEEAKRFWLNKVGIVQVRTPDQTMDILMNGWLIYQIISCRLWGRSALYQSGGAYGFRDQLQDGLGVVSVWPELTRSQILLHAAHQFEEGDVQHWWHPGAGDKGVRTRFSDDLLWLPYVTSEYIKNTGDTDILKEKVPYLKDEPLKKGEDERYSIPRVSEETSTLYIHCVRAIERGLKTGVHGIPLMGSGDWNDGMNTVGNQGRGESVWLGWFLINILNNFAPLCREMDDEDRGTRYLEAAQRIAENIELHAWDGSWYRRAYFDNGLPLGSAENTECKIDSLTQSWAVISGAGQKERIVDAMTAVENYLVKKDEGLVMLLTPPFDDGDLNPGYIKGYVPGVRENGGQYTHAAAWVIYAFAKMGCQDKAWSLYHMINPINHTRTSIESATYKVEPYVIAADVYAVQPHVGRGGWTWYTGSASWMYKVGLEAILGFWKEGKKLYFKPCIPKEWPGFSLRYRYLKSVYQIEVKNPQGTYHGIKSITVNGRRIRDNFLVLVDDGKEYKVEVVLG